VGKKTLELNDGLYDYLLSVSLRENANLKALRDATNQIEMNVMQISPDQGQFMSMLVKLTGAKNILEIGTFTGYSALAMAQSLPEGGKVITCDVSEDWTDIAKQHWMMSGMDSKIQLCLAPAEQTLKELLENEYAGVIDLAFIDADKQNQWKYYEYCLQLLRPGGLILIDNVLWDGKVANPEDNSECTDDIREFNKKLFKDNRVDISMIPVGDGITMARKH